MNQFLLEKFRSESPVFSLRGGGVYGPFIQQGNAESMSQYLLQLEGGNKEPGRYYNSQKDLWEEAQIPALEKALAEIPSRLKKYKQAEKNRGNPPLTEMPVGLKEEQGRLQAKLQVAKEESVFLKREIRKAKAVMKPEPPTILPRRMWANVKFDRETGIMTHIAEWSVAEDPKKNVLSIQDKRSPFNGLEVWRFKSEVLGVIERENSYRQKQAIQEELKSGSPRQPFKAPETPKYDAANGVISYPGYSEKVLEKIKVQQ